MVLPLARVREISFGLFAFSFRFLDNFDPETEIKINEKPKRKSISRRALGASVWIIDQSEGANLPISASILLLGFVVGFNTLRLYAPLGSG